MALLGLERSSNGIYGTWQRYDWRENIFAPQFWIIQALLDNGATVSGAGGERITALQRCVSESAEIQALAGLEVASGRDMGMTAFEATRDGIAAAPALEDARRAALLETVERAAVTRWWLGQLQLRPISPAWQHDTGLLAWLQHTRLGAALQRDTGIWGVELPRGLWLAVARSANSSGLDAVLGYGCDTGAELAVQKALRELLLMELIVAETYVLRTWPNTALHTKLREKLWRITKKSAERLEEGTPLEPGIDMDSAGDTIDASRHSEIESWLGGAIGLHDITPPDGPLSVVLCQPGIAPPEWPGDYGSPFL